MCNHGSGRICSTDEVKHRHQQPPVDRQHSCWNTLLGHSYQWTLLFSWLRLACWLHLLWGCMCFIVFNIFKSYIMLFNTMSVAHESVEFENGKWLSFRKTDWTTRVVTVAQTLTLPNITPVTLFTLLTITVLCCISLSCLSKVLLCKLLEELYLKFVRWWLAECSAVNTGWAKKTGLFLEICNSRICWHRIAFYTSNCSVFYPE